MDSLQVRKISLDEEVRAEVSRKGHLEELLEANQVIGHPWIKRRDIHRLYFTLELRFGSGLGCW